LVSPPRTAVIDAGLQRRRARFSDRGLAPELDSAGDGVRAKLSPPEASSQEEDRQKTGIFGARTSGSYRGMWNLLEEFLAGVGWIGVGVVRTAAGAAGWALPRSSSACLLDSAGTAGPGASR
jgi:hypothetical protein